MRPPVGATLASVFPEYDDPQLHESGLVIVGEDDKRYDRFRDRIMFPIRDVKGLCIGFGGRVLGDEKPKYLNSPETPLFHKGRELYGLFEARDALRSMGYALVTEGYMDVVALAQLGFPNAVATLGTACTADHVQKLFRFTDSVVFSFDGDGAGRGAAHKALEAALPYASDTRSIKFLFLPAEHDPDSFIRAHGSRRVCAPGACNALPLNQFLIEAGQRRVRPGAGPRPRQALQPSAPAVESVAPWRLQAPGTGRAGPESRSTPVSCQSWGPGRSPGKVFSAAAANPPQPQPLKPSTVRCISPSHGGNFRRATAPLTQTAGATTVATAAAAPPLGTGNAGTDSAASKNSAHPCPPAHAWRPPPGPIRPRGSCCGR